MCTTMCRQQHFALDRTFAADDRPHGNESVFAFCRQFESGSGAELHPSNGGGSQHPSYVGSDTGDAFPGAA